MRVPSPAAGRMTKTCTAETKQIQDLSHGKRLMGFCRTNLFKRLESCRRRFCKNDNHHILRNYVVLHAINGLPIPIGTQDSGMLDAQDTDEDRNLLPEEENGDVEDTSSEAVASLNTEADFRARAEAIYPEYAGPYKRRFRWLRPGLFLAQLATDLRKDAKALLWRLTPARWN